MNQLADAFAWCIVQVTLFSTVATCVHAVAARWRWGGNNLVLLISFAAIGALTLLCISRWPRWDASYFSERASSAVTYAELEYNESDNVLTPVVDPCAQSNVDELANAARPDFVMKSAPHERDTHGIKSNEASLLTWWLYVAAAAWFAGAIGMLRFILGLVHLWRCARSSTTMNDLSMCELFAQIVRRLGLRPTVQLRESPMLSAAATFGWRKPLVVLPATWREWSADQRRAVLAHELSHVKQRHFVAWLCSQLPLVAHYYHPLVHWLARQLRFEQELAADRLAARVFGGERRYATVLAELALATPAPRGPITAVGLFMSRPLLMRRLAMLRQSTRRSDQRSGVKQTLILVIIALAAIAVAGVRAAQPNDPTESGAPQKYAPPADPSQQNEPSEQTRITPMAAPWPLNATRYLPGGAPAGPATAVALIQVARQPRRVTGEGHDGESDQAWQVLCKTQLALLKSYFVLQSALRDTEISNLPLIQAQDEPVEWLANRIDVGFKQGSEIMYVQMSGEKRHAEQLRKLVDAVVKKYEEEVVWASEQRRLSNRDLLAQSVKKLGDEISQKMADYLEMAKASESNESGRGQVAQQLDLRRLERIEEELMRLENDQLQLETGGGNGSPIFFEKRIQQLSERRADLEKRIMSRSEASVDLTQRKQEIDRLQQIMDDLSRNLELMDVEARAPPRIQLIQPAIVVGAGEYADGDEGRSEDKPKQ